jgi:hypothetical protein
VAIEIIDVQKKWGAGSPNAFPAFAVDPVAGDMIIAGYGCWNSPASHAAPTDTAGNTYVQIGATIVQGSASCSMWYSKNVVGGSPLTVTGNPSTGHFGMSVWCVRGLKPDPYNSDLVTATGTNPTTNPTVGPTTPPPVTSFFFGVLAVDTNTVPGDDAAWNVTGVNGFTAGMLTNARSPTYNSNMDVFTAYKVSGSAESALWTGTIAASWVAMVASFGELSAAPDLAANQLFPSQDAQMPRPPWRPVPY